jgi:hypothetical protein
MDAISTAPQQTIGIARTATTPDGRFTIHFPLPPHHSKPKVITATGHSRLSAMQHRINDLLNQGWPVICPLSGKLIQVYRRGLHKSQVRTLDRLRSASDQLRITYVHVRFFSARRDGDLAKLELWGLAERMRQESTLEGEKARGMWKITQRGRDFLAGAVRIPRQVAVLEGFSLGYVDETQTMGVRDVQQEFDQEALAEGADGLPTAQQPEAACR